jgi:hypothetical protein
VVIVHRVIAAPRPVRLELSALGTWRDAHGERFSNGAPELEPTADGYVFEHAYRVAGPGFTPAGEWFHGVRYREEAARGLNDHEDLWHAGTFSAELTPGDALTVRVWAGELAHAPAAADDALAAVRARASALVAGSCTPSAGTSSAPVTSTSRIYW